MVETNQQFEQQRHVPAPSERTNVAAALVTTAVWSAVGGLAGRLIGGIGDKIPAIADAKVAEHIGRTGPGRTVGMIIGAVTAGAIAFGTSLKIIGQNRDKHKDLQFSAQTRAVGNFIPTQLPTQANALLPNAIVVSPELEGTVSQEPLELQR